MGVWGLEERGTFFSSQVKSFFFKIKYESRKKKVIFGGKKINFFGLGLTRAGETMPDIEKCDRLAAFYGIKIDALLHYEEKVGKTKVAPPPEGKIPMGNGQGRKPWADCDPERGKRYVCIKRRRPAGSPRG